MIYPNKNIKYKESLLNKMTEILLMKHHGSIRLDDLYEKVKEEFETIDEFLLSLDILYALEAVDLDEETETIIYAS